MKKFFMIAALAVSTLAASAQVYVGGSIGYKSEKNGDAATKNEFSINPEIGYRLDENWGVGIVLGYGTANYAARHAEPACTDEDPANLASYSIAPYVRYTFVKSGKFGAFVDGQFAYSATKRYSEQDFVGTWAINIKPGISYSLSDKVDIVAKVGLFSYGQNDKAKKDKTLNLGLDGTDLQFGVYYNF